MEVLKHAQDKLQRKGVINNVDLPTEWIHNLVITEKKNESLRLFGGSTIIFQLLRMSKAAFMIVEYLHVDMRDS